MSYIIKSTAPFVSIKLTEDGREKLAQGQLTFSYWAIGDSEINYNREEIVDANKTVGALSGTSQVMRPFDRQPNIKSYITKLAGEPLNTLDASNIHVGKAVINNKATERGFFSGVTSTQYETLTSTTYVKSYATISNTLLNGTATLTIPNTIIRRVGDWIMIKMLRNATAPLANNITNNSTPLPYLWYKVQATNATTVTLDRKLPNYTSETSKSSQLFVYAGGEVPSAFGADTSTAYWDSGTLSFDAASNVACGSVPIWNMNNVYSENLAGMTGVTTSKLYEDFTKFGSYSYLGTKNPYFAYNLETATGDTATTNVCDNTGVSYLDPVNKSISILHYTNNTISNFYGEFLYVDNSVNKTVVVTIPDIMYHRRAFATEAGSMMGMKFVASGATQFVDDSDLEFIDLIEMQSYIGTDIPQVVGKVFPQLKIIVFHDDEIVAAISYKSNRNWTLPALAASLAAPSGSTSTGVLLPNKTMYLTYSLENNTSNGLKTALPCQTYVKIDNGTTGAKDVTFRIGEIDALPYMHKLEKALNDGSGFHAYSFKLVYQIVNNSAERPDPTKWKAIDYTSTAITTASGQSIDPIKLENQSPTTNGFVVTTISDSGSTSFDITQSLGMAPNTVVGASTLQFGDERFFYGNIETFIGASIYKTIFDFRVNGSQFVSSTNETRSTDVLNNPAHLKISEIGIYDSDKKLVVIGKLSTPAVLIPGDTSMFELSMDF